MSTNCGFAARLVIAVLTAAPAASRAEAVMAPAASSAEVARLYAEDQADRKDAPDIDWAQVAPRDARRRESLRTLLQAGDLHSGEDFFEAAIVFQHGASNDDILLAHTLALVAVGKGERRGLWIAAASLDRYLTRIGQKQIYGTQFNRLQQPDAPWTQQPYDQALISDTLRAELGVPPLASQANDLADMEAQRKAQAR